MRSNILLALLATLAIASAPRHAAAHGNEKPQHGGIVKTMGETALELVARADGAEVYVREEIDEVPSAGLTGKIVVVKDGVRSETPLGPAGANRLVAKAAKLLPGSRVSVQVVFVQGQRKVSANYAIP